jgi:hypothetical protein
MTDRPTTRTHRQYRRALKTLGWSIVGAAPKLGISRRHSQRVAAGQAKVPLTVDILLTAKLKEANLSV